MKINLQEFTGTYEHNLVFVYTVHCKTAECSPHIAVSQAVGS